VNAILKKMSRADKLRTMEELWIDLTRDQSKYASPSWHFEELTKAEQKFSRGSILRKISA